MVKLLQFVGGAGGCGRSQDKKHSGVHVTKK